MAFGDGLRKGDKWKVPEKVKFIEEKGDQAKFISRRHGTVMWVSEESQIKIVLAAYEEQYGTAKDASLVVDMKNGWFRSNGKVYNRNQGVERASCEYYENGNWYWFDADGSMARNKMVYIPKENKWAYYTHEGKMAKGEMRIGKEHKYYDLSQPGDYHWYYFELDTGACAVSKFVYLSAGNKWVYYNEYGWMVYEEQLIEGNWYYFDENTGAMAKGETRHKDGTIHYYDETTGIRIW